MNTTMQKVQPNIVARAAGEHSIDEKSLGNYLLTGDVTALAPSERAQLLVALAKHIGVDAIARPFMLIPDGKRTVIYARAECADALSRKHGIDTDTISIGEDAIADTRQIVAKVQATVVDVERLTSMVAAGVPAAIAVEAAKRRRSATASIPVMVPEVEWRDGPNGKRIKETIGMRPPTGEEVANMVMKAETKAGRRAIFKLVSLGGISLDSDGAIESATHSGEIIDAYSEPRAEPADWATVCEVFGRRGVTPDQLLGYLKIGSVDLFTDEHRTLLRELAKRIKAGDAGALEELDSMREQAIEPDAEGAEVAADESQ